MSDDVWDAAISTLKRNRAMPRNSCHNYLLRSLIRCAVCGLSFCGTWARTGPRYRCNGSMAHRGPLQGKCIGASIKGEKLEAAVWSDVSRFLTDPSELVDELLDESSDAGACAVAEAERASLLDARSAAQDRRKRAIDLYTRAKLSDTEFDAMSPPRWNRSYRRWMSGWPISNPIRTLPTTPSPRMCWRRSVNAWTEDLSGRATGDRSAARAPDHRPHHGSPTAAASRSKSSSTTASRL